MDCGDNSCLFAEAKGGMRTNGGCRCLRDLPHALQRDIHRRVLSLSQRLASIDSGHARQVVELAALRRMADECEGELRARVGELEQRAESAELGCAIAYLREPTQAEGDAHEAGEPAHSKGECYVAMGGWTGRRCRVCRRWVWGGPTACVGCAGN